MNVALTKLQMVCFSFWWGTEALQKLGYFSVIVFWIHNSDTIQRLNFHEMGDFSQFLSYVGDILYEVSSKWVVFKKRWAIENQVTRPVSKIFGSL